jgi:aminoglycoside 3'-phosphotransferase-1
MASDRREHAIAAIEVPASLALLVQDYSWARDTVGESGDAVYRLHRPAGGPDLYLKHGREGCARDLAGEMARLQWLGSQVPVPAVCYFEGSSDDAWLLMTALRGRTAYQLLKDGPDGGEAVVDALAGFLRRFHAIPVEGCPFNSDHRLRLGEARWRLEAGLVDADDFDESRRGWTARQVWDETSGLPPLNFDAVVTHGDFSLDNIIIEAGVVVGCIDVGRAGIADRYQDVAILWRCLGDFGPALQARLISAYGIDILDQGRLRFHILLDELF